MYGPLPLVDAEEMSVVPGWSMEITGTAESASFAVTVTVTAPTLRGAVREYVIA